MLMSFFPWILYVLAWVCTLIAVHLGAPLYPNLLLYIIVFNGGIQGLWAAVGHLAFPKKTAKRIGWQSNGFQTEIGFANLGIGITGVLTYFLPWLALGIGMFIAIFYAGCAYNHIKERIIDKNKAACNSGPMMYSTIATFITLTVCLIAVV